MALIRCPECGKEISSNAKNCPNCGNPINDDTFTKEVKASKKVAVFIIILLVIICVIGFIFGYFIPAHTHITLKDGVMVKEFRLF